ncbi:MAG: sigma factor-like helix-turn-helix DNA-binding protein [Patescibacteria group bacterium]|jgi:predicted Zn-ribbon and HTH transcriptional regulator
MDTINPIQSDASAQPGGDGSLLKRFLSESETAQMNILKPFKLVSGVLGDLREREREVLVMRYGLSNSEASKETLESIGRRFTVTRERVRQIEHAALKKVSKKFSGSLKPIIKAIESYLLANGNIAEMEHLAQYFHLQPDNLDAQLDAKALRLLMDAYDKVVPLKKQPLFKEGWVAKTITQDLLVQIEAQAQKTLELSGKAISETELVRQINQQLPNIDSALIAGVFKVSHKLGLDHQGAWGLSAWPLVMPRRIRDKVFIVLEEAGKPLHFEDITRLIQKRYPSEKKVLNRTVHNELIGDARFVLVGRGIYALRVWGYQPGVVADVIKQILQKAGRPLTVGEIVAEVLKSRQVKKNTIIANLQNHALFKKVAKSTYVLSGDPSNPEPHVN